MFFGKTGCFLIAAS